MGSRIARVLRLGAALVVLLGVIACSGVRPQPIPPSPSPAMSEAQPASPPPSQPQPVPEVPAEWRALYQELSAELKVFEDMVKQSWDGKRSQVTIAVEQAYANGNAG